MLKCVIIDDDKISRVLLSGFISKHPEIELIGEFENAMNAISVIQNNKPHIVFLDLEMPEFSGKEFLETYGTLMENVIIITAHQNFAVRAFEYNVSGYLLKPFSMVEFNKAIKKISDKISKEKNNPANDIQTIFVKKGSTIKKLNITDVFLIECIGDYVNLYTDKEKFTIHSTMKGMEEKFPVSDYLRVHRSFIVRIDRIDEIEDDTMSFGSKIVPIGKTYKQAVLSRINLF